MTGCSTSSSEEVTDDTEETKQTFITLDNFGLDNHSKMIISEDSSTNGAVIGSSTEDTLDYSHFEAGLMRIGKENFGEDKYLLADNSIFSDNEEMDKLFADNAVNVLAYHYYDKVSNSEISLSGMVIGIQVSSRYSGNSLTNVVNHVSQTILDILRSESLTSNVPIVFAVFHQQPAASQVPAVPGNFILRNDVDAQSNTIGEWTNINERYFVYPSSDLTNSKQADASELDSFMSDLRNSINSRNFIGGSALLLYRDNELSSLSFTININFQSNTEVIALTQKIGELIETNDFFHSFDVQITISSNDGHEALITKGANSDDVFTHIYN